MVKRAGLLLVLVGLVGISPARAADVTIVAAGLSTASVSGNGLEGPFVASCVSVPTAASLASSGDTYSVSLQFGPGVPKDPADVGDKYCPILPQLGSQLTWTNAAGEQRACVPDAADLFGGDLTAYAVDASLSRSGSTYTARSTYRDCGDGTQIALRIVLTPGSDNAVSLSWSVLIGSASAGSGSGSLTGTRS